MAASFERAEYPRRKEVIYFPEKAKTGEIEMNVTKRGRQIKGKFKDSGGIQSPDERRNRNRFARHRLVIPAEAGIQSST
jgi:hypothetical protein